jgi:putative ABC transport system permease protein
MGRIGDFFSRRDREQKLDSELRFHLERQIGENMASGMSPDQARREASIEFGGLDQVKEECRDVRSGRWLDALIQDIHYGLRGLCRSRGFTCTALATIGIGVGANAAIFSFVDCVLLKPPPFPDADQIVWVSEKQPNGSRYAAATLTYLDWAKQSTVFENIAAIAPLKSVSLTGIENPLELSAWPVSAHYFDVFPVRPALGRTFVEGEDQVGRDHVVVMTNSLWRSQFGADPGVIGRSITLDGEPFTVIGVLPKGFFDRLNSQAIFLPLAFAPESLSRDYRWMGGALARLKPGVAIEQARAQMDAIGERMAHDYPESNKGWGVMIERFGAVGVDIGEGLRLSLYMLMGAVGMVLLIVCANLASLTLARGMGREREVAIRASLGAGRWRLVRQFLTESLLLSCAGGTLGLLVAYGGLAALKLAAPAGYLPPFNAVTMDGRVLLFMLGLSILTGVIFGLVPAIRESRPDLTRAFKEGGPGASVGRFPLGLRGALVVTEVALAFVLLSGAGLLIRSFIQVRKVDAGFDSTNVVTARLPISNKRFPSATEFNLYLHRIIERIGSLPGVRDSALTVALPMEAWIYDMGIRIAGAREVDAANRPHVFLKQVTPSYFRTLGMRLSRGRLLSNRDLMGTPPVTVINESLAKKFFPNENPVGKHIMAQEVPYAKTQLGREILWEVVGVVKDEKVWRLSDRSEYCGMYVSEDQSPQTQQFLIVRAAMDPAALQNSIRDAVHDVDPDQVLDQMKTLEQIEAESMGDDRIRSSLFAIFAGMALLLAGMGLYGVISYSVMQRTREIGIRTALGATSANIVSLVLRSGIRMTCIGLAIGVGGAFGVSQFLESMLFGVGKHDPETLVAVGGILSATAVLACYIPARRALKVDPLIALRCE